MIQQFAGDGRQFGLDVSYSSDGESLRGTAGAVRNALPKLGEKFLVLYGDSYLPCDYQAVERAFLASGRPALMTVLRNRNQGEISNVEFADGQIAAYEKATPTALMEYVDYGLSAFHASVFSAGAERYTDLGTVFQQLIRHRELAGFEVRERFYEVGSWEGIRELRAHLSPRINRAQV
jgi:NDP-sugar pyrophosphorylase family protein